mmetsp:Transcript_603/g.1043  ORF Transcript_603/g.1043 Transcript_603/m.1043 type:complete len:85 (-) Transcript_603:252-506(-)|eukprot:CAMPEP_0114109014 /NCGR_PEP_ID=MMETSP0043_2-20121206/540_1 /TAXON_ID=464988 /ORGANISM="Hemiselmis andersenii, Strain CCMP644" /LENGTH=84 /DNA_ID=CAMNT_0001200843 /DNA_START=166 /DNA_END=420 /DNA_ORIENTATION=+
MNSLFLRTPLKVSASGVRFMCQRPMEGTWAYVARRRELQAAKEVSKPFQKVSKAIPAAGREPWQDLAKCNKGHFSHIHHGQTKL